jgi:succinate-semialdehyde dehydrogenase/glutarate-semialdehyde dehydrogenase
MNYPELVQLYIDGQWRAAAAGQTIVVKNPVNNAPIGEVAKADPADLDLALAGAEAGFQTWRNTVPAERGAALRRVGGLLRERAKAIASLMTLEHGKPLAQAEFEINNVANDLEWFGDEATRVYGRLIPSRMPSGLPVMVTKEPVGPVAAFTPWNFPVHQMARKIGPALVAGCSIIVKGPEEAPVSAAEFIRVFHDAGIPNGVVNLVFGDPPQISEHLIASPVIRKVSFTGSVAVGKHLAAMAGRYMKRATMELGGHAPVIVCDDADVGATVALVGTSKFSNAGQVCASPTRFLVQRAVYDEFVEGIVGVAKNLKVGDGMLDGTQMGPLINEKRLEAIESLVADSVSLGAKIETGGRRIGNEGNFFEPTVLTNISRKMRVMNEEPFGPLALMLPFDTLDEALAEANRLPYGLGATAFSTSVRNLQQITREIECGMLRLNLAGPIGAEVPFGGVKDSGFGLEGGPEAIDAYLATKVVFQGLV